MFEKGKKKEKRERIKEEQRGNKGKSQKEGGSMCHTYIQGVQ